MNTFPNSILTGKPLTKLFSLGELYVSDFKKPEEDIRVPRVELELGIDTETGLVQLTKQPPAEFMWGDIYWYKSGTNDFMKDALNNVVQGTLGFIQDGQENDIWLDIAGNDGTLLSLVPKSFFKINIDPSAYPEAEDRCDAVVKDYFSANAYLCASNLRARVITCCAMFYDLSDPIKFLKDVAMILRDDGIFVLQLSYTPLMIVQNELGNICHEHIAYYTLKSLKYALNAADLTITDLELNNVNGGSIRLYCQKSGVAAKFKTQADRDIANIRVESLAAYEQLNLLNEEETYQNFYSNMCKQRRTLLTFLRQQKALGKTVWGYGASTKGNTMLQWLGLDSNDIQKLVERQGRKVGLEAVGSGIPIVSEEEARAAQPDYMIVFPWHFISEFQKREEEYLKKGGKFIVLSPTFRVIGYED